MEEVLTKNGRSTLVDNHAEVVYISRSGLILKVKGNEYYLPYEVFDVQLIGNEHIRWKNLDVDLSLSILQNPEKYPLVAK